MTMQEFNALIAEDGVKVEDKEVFSVIHEHYMNSKSNKFDYCYDIMIAFKDYVWKNLNYLLLTDKQQLFYHFVIHELGSYCF